MENLVGQTLNRYQIISLLGEGGMGAVYRAHDTTLQRDVAIKIMHPHFARQPNFQERFLQEARTAARLDHPGIVQIHDFGSYRSQLYIVMKFIPGANLEEMLRDLRNRGRWIPLGEGVQLVRQTALALDYAHRQGVLHRDIKPGNIMIEPEPSDGLPYRPVVTDLGLAKLVQGGVMTQDGSSMGTPAYMSPEQALGKVTDARSDVYSLGILLYELAVGRLPFNPRTLQEAVQDHVHTPPTPPRAIRPEIPEGLEQVILQTLQKDPSRRFQSALALAEALQGAASNATRVGSAPAGLQGTVSLLTEYQNSLVDLHAPAVFAPSGPGGSDRMQILAGDQSSRELAFTPPAMILGRDPSADIFIDDPKISRQHARIEFDGRDYRVVDLNSTNGSFLGGRRLAPNLPQLWQGEEALRVGGAHLRLLRAGSGAGAGPAPYPAEATRRDEALYQVYPPPPAGTTRVAPAAAPAAPAYEFSSQLQPDNLRSGEIGQVIVHNHGAGDHFSLHWISPGEALDFTPPYLEVDIPPGQEVVAEFRAEPRRVPLVGGERAYPFSAQVSPSAGAAQMHHGQVRARAVLPGWAIPLLLVLCLALAALSGLLFGGGGELISGADATRTANEAATQIALAVQQTRAAGSATAQALEGVNAATRQSATQTGQAQAAIEAAALQARQTSEAAAATQAGAQTSVALTAMAQSATFQAGAQQTAAAQNAAQQTALAQQAALAATEAAQSLLLTSQAGALQLTAQSQAATQTAAVQRRLAYISGGDYNLANDFSSFLQAQGYLIDVIRVDDVDSITLTPYTAILIGPDTGNPAEAKTAPWGDPAGSQAGYIAASGRPILGLGTGGSLFFQAANAFINFEQSWSGQGGQVYVPDPASPYWNDPERVDIGDDQIARLYENNPRFVAVYLPEAQPDVIPIARQADNPDHYLIIQQGPRSLLWGFDPGPSEMTQRGRQALVNILWNFAP